MGAQDFNVVFKLRPKWKFVAPNVVFLKKKFQQEEIIRQANKLYSQGYKVQEHQLPLT